MRMFYTKHLDEIERSLEKACLNDVTKDFVKKAVNDAENKLKLLMFDVGDFNPAHYEMKHECDTNYLLNRFDVIVQFDYVATERQKKVALNILKKIHGKKDFEDKRRLFHPKSFMLEEKKED